MIPGSSVSTSYQSGEIHVLRSPLRNALAAVALTLFVTQFATAFAGDTPPANDVAEIKPCCTSIETGSKNEVPFYKIRKNSKDLDPYISGPGRDLPDSASFVKKGVDYFYEAPKFLGHSKQISQSISYSIESKLPTETYEDYYNRRLAQVLQPGESIPISNVATEVGQGSQSRVYLTHPKMPTKETLALLYPDEAPLRARFPSVELAQARGLEWATENSSEVVKVRTPTPWHKTLVDSSEQARRDIALTEIFEACANEFFISDEGEKKKLIEVVHYNNAHAELEHGIFRQPTVNGETAFMVGSRVQDAKAGNSEEATYLIEKLRFKSWQDAERKLRLLEAFYGETHYDVIQFELANDIPRMGGRARTASPVLTVGFDYNQGANAIWDPQKGLFRAIDF